MSYGKNLATSRLLEKKERKKAALITHRSDRYF